MAAPRRWVRSFFYPQLLCVGFTGHFARGFLAGGQLFDRRVGLIAVALMSFSAYHIRYAQEARSYSLFVLLATLSSGYFVASMRAPASDRNRCGYILASVLPSTLIFTHCCWWPRSGYRCESCREGKMEQRRW